LLEKEEEDQLSVTSLDCIPFGIKAIK